MGGHIRGIWNCAYCETLIQAPVPAQVIDKGIPTSGVLICDDNGGYQVSFGEGMTEIGCMAQARRKFFDLQAAGKSQLAASIMSLIQSEKLNGYDPYAYPKDVLRRLPAQKNNAIRELLPHNWKLVTVGKA